MGRADLIIKTTVILIFLVFFVSGPLVPAVSLTNATEPTKYGQGNIAVKNTTLPPDGTLRAAKFGAANYNLLVPPATVRITSITGYPAISYSVEIRSVGVNKKITLIKPASADRLNVTMEPTTVHSEHITERQYQATLSLAVRDSNGTRTVATRNATITVIE